MKPKARERVLCFEEATGKPLWTFSYDVCYPEWAFTDKQEYGPVATPVVRDGRVFTLGANGIVHCLDACNGNVLWKKNLGPSPRKMLTSPR